MIWIWLLTRQSHKWSTGAMDRYFAYVCAHCRATTSAMVRTFGFGNGANHMAAERAAHAAADAFAFRAVSAAACPCCGELQPQVIEGFARAAKKSAKHGKLRVPLAAMAALLTLVLLAIPAIRDLKHSPTLTAVALSTAVAVGGLFFAIFSGQVITPSTNPNGVWFSRDPGNGPTSWFPAQPGRAPFVAQPAPLLRVLSLLAMGVTGMSALVALILWGQTFRKVYVVSSEGPFGSLSVQVDGKDEGKTTESPSDDAPNLLFEVRTDSKHHVVVTDGRGRQTAYDLDPATATNGWVITPHAKEHGLCLASITWYYGTTPKEGADTLVGEGVDVVPLPHSFDHMFTQPPATVQTKNGASETRTSLRAFDCASLDEEKQIPFKVAPPRKPRALPKED